VQDENREKFIQARKEKLRKEEIKRFVTFVVVIKVNIVVTK